MKQFHSSYVKTQVGVVKILCDSSNILSLDIANEPEESIDNNNLHVCSVCESAVFQLQEYFNGQLKMFDLPVVFRGSKLQVAVWNFLRTIPYGITVSYSQVANAVNCKSVRAVATIIGKNPVPIIVPCHRVIRKDGTIGEFSLVGPELKKRLLEHEKANL
ncbi:MAG TPA: methylated-DNA--[protein]-cysteine S-methyltransferase [Oscillospiraceae bacterium]|nr:methylated-DNA--[protein]-cysteine S-methyltransferase [Oscillospiraceae bacterium]